MKKIFTLLLVLIAAIGFAQKGAVISLPQELTGKVVVQDKAAYNDTQTLLPGNWASVNQVGTYRWTDGQTPPTFLGWIFGNNSYGAIGAGVKFNVPAEKEVVGAYFWFGAVGAGDDDIVLGVYQFSAGLPGALIGSVTISLEDITAFATGGETPPGPNDYTNAFYVTFDTPILVNGDFFVGFDAGDVTWAEHGDGLGLASGVVNQGGGGAGIAYILHDEDGWEPATVWNAVLDLDLAIFPVVQDPGSGGDGFTVTFNVDLTGVEGFDPADHEVWIAGNFLGWNEPGTGNSVQMQLVAPSKDTPPFNLYENFDGFEDFTTNLSPWITLQLTQGPTWGSNAFDFPGEGSAFAWMAFNPSQTTPSIAGDFPAFDGAKYAIAIQYTDYDDNKWLISPEVSINETSELSFYAKSYTAAYGLERIKVMVSTTDAEPSSFVKISDGDFIEVPTAWTHYSFDLSDFAGETIHFAINYVSEDAFIFMLDAIKLEAEGDEPEELIYTATLEIEAGEILYKYFSTAFGVGWAGGEWDGDPNRMVEITEDVVLNDVWGVQPGTSVNEIQLDMDTRVYPNPVRNTLYIKSQQQIDYLRVFDLAGRLVYNAEVMDTETTLDANQLRAGLYILQMISGKQVKTHKIQVVK